jgi:pimeloyl-ACP methyl ester carboxylesterase
MKDLLFLHGALGAKTQLTALAELLKDDFNIHTLNFDGHGDRPTDQPFSIDLFAQNLSDHLDEQNLSGISVFGYSMGGYVALKLALLQPFRFERIITLGTKFKWNPEEAVKESKMLNPVKIEEKVPAFAKYLSNLHTAQDWKINMDKTAQMMLDLGNGRAMDDEQFSRIKTKCFIGVGDNDAMVTREETEHAARTIPRAEFYMLENTIHPIDKIDMNRLAQTIREMIL